MSLGFLGSEPVTSWLSSSGRADVIPPTEENRVTPDQLKADLETVLADRRLLDHPFYRRWAAGELQLADLGDYASQYRHFEVALPGILRGLAGALGEGTARDLIRQNLLDEESNPEPHVELFASFADAVGAAPDAPASAGTARLVDTYHDLIDAGPAQGLAGFAAYEMQAPSIAASKAQGLRERYGLDFAATRFWDVHADMDVRHADWTVAALAALPQGADGVLASARRAADAWWGFLDEREERTHQRGA